MLHTTEGVLKPHKEGEAQVTSTSHPPLGILMLETEFERVVGDGGNPATWAFPTRLETISAATPDAVVHRGAHALVDEFVAAGRRLANAGVVGITTSCGFLILHQALRQHQQPFMNRTWHQAQWRQRPPLMMPMV